LGFREGSRPLPALKGQLPRERALRFSSLELRRVYQQKLLLGQPSQGCNRPLPCSTSQRGGRYPAGLLQQWQCLSLRLSSPWWARR
jgi:hypothetical protein